MYQLVIMQKLQALKYLVAPVLDNDQSWLFDFLEILSNVSCSN